VTHPLGSEKSVGRQGDHSLSQARTLCEGPAGAGELSRGRPQRGAYRRSPTVRSTKLPCLRENVGLSSPDSLTIAKLLSGGLTAFAARRFPALRIARQTAV